VNPEPVQDDLAGQKRWHDHVLGKGVRLPG